MNKHWNIDDYDQTTGEELHQAHARLKEKIWERIPYDKKYTKKSRIIKSWIPMGVAAALLIITGYLWDRKNEHLIVPILIPSSPAIVQPSSSNATVDSMIHDANVATSNQQSVANAPTISTNVIKNQKVENQNPEKENAQQMESFVNNTTPPKIENDIAPNEFKNEESLVAQSQPTKPLKKSIHINRIPGIDDVSNANASELSNFIDKVHEPNKQNFASHFTIRKQH